MDIFEYLPQLIVAYDGNDEFANLVHVKKADKDNNYYCPCCGGTVKPRALDSNKEQSHYYHKTGKCTKESQLHFFCKNWLFETGSKFYIDKKLFEVVSIDIEKTYFTQFGDYKPDITVHTSCGKVIFFEMFFSNRKTGDDYFCKWNALGNDVVEVNIKEYMFKTDETVIPTFTYLYHDGICHSKTYEKKDLYATTIARIKRELTRQKILNYKARIEQLDWFWQQIRSNETRESILEVIASMDYEDMISCYSIIKRKQCVSYLKNDVLNMINQKVMSDIRNSLDLPHDENVYFDLKHIHGRTYEAGIRLNIKTEHIIYDDFCYHCVYEGVWKFDKLKEYPKIVFSKNLYNINEITIPDNRIDELKDIFEKTLKFKKELFEFENKLSDLEGNNYKIRVKNNLYTVLAKIHDNNFEVVLKNFYIRELDIKSLSKQIQCKIKEIKDKDYLDVILNSPEYCSIISELQNYKDIGCEVDIKYDNGWTPTSSNNAGIRFKLYLYNKIFYNEILQPTFDDFVIKINDCKNIIDNLIETHSIIINLVKKINACKNNFWKAEILFDYDGNPEIKIDQKLFEVKKPYLLTYEKVYFNDLKIFTEQEISKRILDAMHLVFENVEHCGYRIMEERD